MKNFIDLPTHALWFIWSQLDSTSRTNLENCFSEKKLRYIIQKKIEGYSDTFPDSHRGGIYTQPKSLYLSDKEQLFWNAASWEAVQKIIFKLREKPSITDLLIFVGMIRANIAKNLHHGDKKTSKQFGLLRGCGNEGEDIWMQEKIRFKTGPWQHLWLPCLEKMLRILSSEDSPDLPYWIKKKLVENSSRISIKIETKQYKEFGLVLSVETDCKKTQQGTVVEFNQNTIITIDYPIYPLDAFANKFKGTEAERLDQAYQRILDYDGKNFDELIKLLAKFCYVGYRGLIFRRGNAAAFDWMARAMAELKGFDLSYFNPRCKLPPDFDAFCSSPEEYEQGFSTAYERLTSSRP